MVWTPLAERFQQLPLILAGPIVRRVEPSSVTVWMALKEAQKITLCIYEKNEHGELIPRLSGTRQSVRLGDALHIVAVTATPVEGEQALNWGALYYYDLFFQNLAERSQPVTRQTAHLATPGILTQADRLADPLSCLVYPGHPLPGFVLPPEDLNALRIFHGSCRKPHGVGKEMLSALDVLIEENADNPVHRPQQLFLTGDQIYADDVPEPLLYTLVDAVDVLFAGNQEEILPLVEKPARSLEPGRRASLVRKIAKLTSGKAKSHLLSLSEYMMMYLLTWSDVLWPKELPIREVETQQMTREKLKEVQEYTLNTERLHEFYATLPNVRRALANIATYMICDDHDITDDWYLDGAWCQNVMNNPLGRWVIRNGMIAYALCQGWGNTPAQFEEPKGRAFLTAIDRWYGTSKESGQFDRLLGLSTDFCGEGQLHHSQDALQWHYTFSTPHYQIIVLDIRTQRIYHTAVEFPGLMSLEAIERQIISAARKDVDVTIIVSPTPVLGVNLIEDLQFWSRLRSKNNYVYDRESWSLERFTLQNFLKAIGGLKRVVILSGDVHYAFGSSLEYWDRHNGETAKIVNYTSSSLHNEETSSQMALLAVGFPQLIYLFGLGRLPSVDLFAWDVAEGNSEILEEMIALIKRRIYRFWWSVPRLMDVYRSPRAVVFPGRGWLKGSFQELPPDRMYRLRYLRNTRSPLRHQIISIIAENINTGLVAMGRRLLNLTSRGYALIEMLVLKARNKLLKEIRRLQRKSAPPTGPLPGRRRSSVLQKAVRGTVVLERGLEEKRTQLASEVIQGEDRLSQWKAGIYIVGYTNIGEIRFHWGPQEQTVIQRLWWWHRDNQNRPMPGTEYREDLQLPNAQDAPILP